MTTATKFSAGERVSITRITAFTAPSGIYEVIGALPRDSGPQRYRVRNPSENFDRIMDEARLEALGQPQEH
ncbi:MAG TPA: hypothetical protein VEA80_14855 [Vitreimonas sp.]|uniref:hypothetical protein n=1 Tax=Vitreimonas sp. TaxID=3069702 RepID=UPI002D6BF964|nr:hypothetical protein [Vitreimonas sp.]HYD88752.1 hypothetical protein [Vitreimonas sp.]